MTRRAICAFAVTLIVAGACRRGGQTAAPDGREFPHVIATIDRHAPTMDDLAALTYSRTGVGTVSLEGGMGRSPAGGQTVELDRDFRLVGDITQNGTEEAVAVLHIRNGPRVWRQDLVVVGWSGGQLLNLATTPLPERFTVTSGRIEPHRIIVEGHDTEHGDARRQLAFVLDGSTLTRVDP